MCLYVYVMVTKILDALLQGNVHSLADWDVSKVITLFCHTL